MPPQALDGMSFTWRNGASRRRWTRTGARGREQALLLRADLWVAIGDYAAASKLQLAVARQYPQFMLSPGYYWDHGIANFHRRRLYTSAQSQSR